MRKIKKKQIEYSDSDSASDNEVVKIRKRRIKYSDSNDASEQEEGINKSLYITPAKPIQEEHEVTPVRSSDRIKQRSQKTFRMPSRNEVLDKIEDLPSPQKGMETLKPRRLVNDYTKENNRYNYDIHETTDESLEEDFLVDDEQYIIAEEMERERWRKRRKKRKEREKRRRSKEIVDKNGSSDDSDGPSGHNRSHPTLTDDRGSDSDSIKGHVRDKSNRSLSRIESSDSGAEPKPSTSQTIDNVRDRRKSKQDNSDEIDSYEIVSPHGKRKKRNNSLLSSSSDNGVLEAEEEDSVSYSDDSDSDGSPTDRAQVMAAKKQERKNRFAELKKRRMERLSKDKANVKG